MSGIVPLQKMLIKKLDDTGTKTVDSFEVMFNPNAYKESYGMDYEIKTSIGGGEIGSYSGSFNESMVLDFILDTSYTNVYRKERDENPGKYVTVDEKISQFLKISGYKTERKLQTGKPSRLKIEWGRLDYECYLNKVDVEYKKFDNSGSPIRALLIATFKKIPYNPNDSGNNNTSPDATKAKVSEMKINIG